MNLPDRYIDIGLFFDHNITKPAYKAPDTWDKNKDIGTSRQSFWIVFPQLVKALNPENVFEWGPGNSTYAFLVGNSEVEVYSYEHDKKWYDYYLRDFKTKRPDLLGRWHPYYVPDVEKYIETDFPDEHFDIVFIDGIKRRDCFLRATKLVKNDGLIIAHDTNHFYSDYEWLNPSWAFLIRYTYFPERSEETSVYINIDRLKDRDFLIKKFNTHKRTFPK